MKRLGTSSSLGRGGIPPAPGLDGGTPSSLLREVPPIPGLDRGYPILLTGVPQGMPCPDLGWGTPLISRMEYPPSGPGMGYPRHLDLGWGIPRPDLR